MNTFSVLVYVAWLLSEILINRMMRSGARDADGKDKASLGFIWIAIAVGVGLSVYISGHINAPIVLGFPIGLVGLLVILAGVLMRLAVIRSLGRFFTADVTIRQDHALKQDGFYKYLRHPSYTASLISFAGFGLSLNNWISLALIVCTILIAFIYRIRVEEEALIGHFGEAYRRYRQTTKAIIPFIY
ncbi:methyltransferase family protein [Taibaiella chishuiensis]|uniref:Protein-S-isoprenylcysteine O-methyltransferase Ste14 n=1 Tax=Taibaiella chishuiensis TaxID=1434707 RepID=A0A2P8D4G2_9BACT|nr:isoprenylcysteine carboxylmethyltransferase family protein [Taibaiella chishuiensis]PSK92100.1 protein-S-isoprenylcysteine O-methyltransferase Ste14 [Taibaiella chishuiensis]